MVELVFNMQGYMFEAGTKVLRQSYSFARDALATQVENVMAEVLAYQKSGEFIGERDEEGFIITSLEDQLDYEHQLAEDALRALRRSYAIALYHHWERGSRLWTNAGPNTRHPQLAERVAGLGLAIHPRLHPLWLVTNLLKHDSNKWGKRVKEEAPELLDSIQVMAGVTEWYEAVVLSESHMDEFFDAVAASGPTISTIFPAVP